MSRAGSFVASRLYDLGYRWFTMPWELGPRTELVGLLQAGRLPRGRALDLGCGTGANAIYLAANGFDVTGVDFSRAALDKAQNAARKAGVAARFVRDDLTSLTAPLGRFDLLVDYGTFDDLSLRARRRYLAQVVPLIVPGGKFLLWAFEWAPRRVDRMMRFRPLAPGDVHRYFGEHFTIERIDGTQHPDMRRLIPGNATYLMIRKQNGPTSSP
jgi:SAM-dependent methyltransferase